MKRLPKTVSIGSYKLRIVPLLVDMPEKLDGALKLTQRMLIVSPDLTPEDTVLTVLHELLHAALDIGSIKVEERDVLVLEQLLAQALQDLGWLPTKAAFALD